MTKKWEIALNNKRYVVEAKHGYFSGKVVVKVNDKVVLDTKPRYFMPAYGRYGFKIDNHEVALVIGYNWISYGYDLAIDGKSVKTGKVASNITNFWGVGPITSREQAEEIVKQVSGGVFALAGITALLGFVVGWWILVDVIILIVFGILLYKFKNKWVARGLNLYFWLNLVTTILNLVGVSHAGGKNIFLAMIAVFISGKAVQAAVFLEKEKGK